MAKNKVDRAVRIMRALSDVRVSVHVETWDVNSAALAALDDAVAAALEAARIYADSRRGLALVDDVRQTLLSLQVNLDTNALGGK